MQDDHVAEVAGREQVWTAGGWADRFGLPFDDSATGYGFSADDVAAVRVDSADLLLGYAAPSTSRRRSSCAGCPTTTSTASSTSNWDPPVTLGVRLVSVLSDDLQHVGQAAYVRGLLESGAGR